MENEKIEVRKEKKRTHPNHEKKDDESENQTEKGIYATKD